MIINRIVVGALAALAVLSTVACSPETGTPAPVASPSAGTTSQAEPESLTIDRPSSAFGIDCEALLPTAQLNDTIGQQTTPVEFPFIGPQLQGAQGAALAQDGALLCSWGVDPFDNSGLIIALPDGAGGFDRSVPSFLDYAAASTPLSLPGASSALARCDDSFQPDGTRCSWSLKKGDTWVFASFAHVPPTDYRVPEPRSAPDGSIKPLMPVADGSKTAGLLVAALDRLGAAPRVELAELRSPVLQPCEEIMDVERIAAALSSPMVENSPAPNPRSLEDSLGRSSFRVGEVMWAYSFERLGFSECQAISPNMTDYSVEILTAPGIAWTLENPSAVFGGDYGPVGDLGDGWTRCDDAEAEARCSLAVARGRDLLTVEIAGLSDLESAIEVVRTLLQ